MDKKRLEDVASSIESVAMKLAAGAIKTDDAVRYLFGIVNAVREYAEEGVAQ